MSRQDQEGEHQEVSQAFYGGPRLILRSDDFDEAYDESVKKIWSDFDQVYSAVFEALCIDFFDLFINKQLI